MKVLAGVAAMLLLASGSMAATSTPVGFTDDYEAALARAKKEGKIVIADFSGSDWCFWCKRLDDEVFKQEAFLSVATNKYVLLMIDSPNDKSLLSEKAKTQNRKLVRQYHVSGFPTVLLLNDEGQILGETGFVGGGPEKYLKHLEERVDLIPDFLEWIKPLDKRISGFYAHFREEMTAKVKAVADKSKEEQAAVERAAILKLVEELEAILAEERGRTPPARIAEERAKRLAQATEGAKQLRLHAERKGAGK